MKNKFNLLFLLFSISLIVNAQFDPLPPPGISPFSVINSLSQNVGTEGTNVTINSSNSSNLVRFGVNTSNENTYKLGSQNLPNTSTSPFKTSYGFHEVYFNYGDDFSILNLGQNSVISSIEFYVQSGTPIQYSNFKIYMELGGYFDFSSITYFGYVFEKETYTPVVENGKVRIVFDKPIVISNEFINDRLDLIISYDNNNIGIDPLTALSVESSNVYETLRPNMGINIFTFSGGIPATSVNVVNSTTLIAQVPNVSSGRILLGGEGSYAISKDVFTYIPTTQVQASQCGTTISSINETIVVDAVDGAEGYRYKISRSGAPDFIWDRTSNTFTLNGMQGGAAYNATYTVSVSVLMNGTYGLYGDSCTITTLAPLPTTRLRNEYCDVTIGKLDEALTAFTREGADRYRFEVSVNGQIQSVSERGTNVLFLNTITGGVKYSTTYHIRVALRVGGTWSEYGQSCTVTTPHLYSRIRSEHCGTTLVATNSTLYAIARSQAQRYRYEVSEGGNVQTFESSSSSFNLTQSGSIKFNTAYTVRVALRYDNQWAPYGESCVVTTPLQTTRVRDELCGKTLSSINSNVTAYTRAGANAYSFEVSLEGLVLGTVQTSQNYIRLTQISGIEYNKSYSVRVRCRYSSVWSEYGSVCLVNTPSVAPKGSFDSSEEIDTRLYPNPYNESFKVAFSSDDESKVQVLIYDASGRLVSQKETTSASLENQEFGQGLSTGVYTVLIQQGERVETLRVVKQ